MGGIWVVHSALNTVTTANEAPMEWKWLIVSTVSIKNMPGQHKFDKSCILYKAHFSRVSKCIPIATYKLETDDEGLHTSH